MRHGPPLLERDAELGAVDLAIGSALAGDGTVVVVEGPAGIGKTSLLNEAAGRAAAEGATVLSAQGAVLERDFGFGAVRQLFEPALRRADATAREQLLAGAAGLARPVVSPDVDEMPASKSAVMHGLYWLTANLAAVAALFIVVDDVQWCDIASVEFLVYLARRLEGLAAALVVGLRTGDPDADGPPLGELVASPFARVVRPPPLTVDGVRHLIEGRMGRPEPQFAEACHRATGGVPFLVHELLRALNADGVMPTDAEAGRISETGPRTVARATMLRLSRLRASTASVARAVAVLDRQARLDRVAVIAETDLADARAAVDALAGMDVLGSGHPPRFSHPLVRQAVYDDMSSTMRADAHRRVADLLTAEKASPDEIAVHLLQSEPAGREDVVDALRAAATQALVRGAPASAVSYLRRARAEGALTGQQLASLLHELGSAEAFAWDPRALKDLAAARELEQDPVQRARIGWEVAQSHLMSGDWGSMGTLAREVLAELGGRDHNLEAIIEGVLLAADSFDSARSAEVEPRLIRLHSLVDRGGPGTRMLALILAVMTVYRCGDRVEARKLVEHGLDGGRLLRDEGSESLALVQAISALVALDDLDAAERAIHGVFDDARRRGSAMGYTMWCFYRTLIDARRGQLQVAESYFRSAIERSLEMGAAFAIPSVMWAGTDVLLERPGVDDLAGLVESIELEPAMRLTVSGAWILMTRGRLRLLHGRREEGIADLRAAGEIVDQARLDNPIAVPWRSPLALALPPEERDEAQTAVAYELDRARAMGLARSEGAALRAAGILEGGDCGMDLMHQSLNVLERVDAPLERARTLVEIGAAMRRANQRSQAREPLAAGLELAHVCGAERLAARATEELHASGARPRRARTFGPDSLTSAEARVARMAADGMTNKDIAQALFVTAKTVENQLGAVYRKLGVRSREELGGVLVDHDTGEAR